jgi:2-keto-4-pentenoate hydratase/2-oxohepta-3-ene-1,7-dioic acid hydratase in catechol pathway
MPSVWCALRTFAFHAAELGNAEPAAPHFFLKPWAALAHPPDGCEVELPAGVHHEVELVIELVNHQLSRVAIGLDLTDRALQSQAKAEGMPWTRAKGFRNSALLGEWAEPPVGLNSMRIELAINGEPRQEASISEMSFSPLALLESLGEWAPLEDGDLLFCGTPSGVGEIHLGDELHARLLREDGTVLSELRFTAAPLRAD